MKRRIHLNHNIVCMIVISLIANMSGSMILPLFAIYVEQFGISALNMSILFSLFYVGRFLGGGLAGRIYEKIGAKRLGLSLLLAEIMCMLLFPIAATLTKQLLLYSTVHFLEMSAFAIFLTYFSVYATYKFHWSPVEISLAFTIIGVSTFVSAPFMGKVSDLLKDRLILSIIGLLLIMVEIALFLWFTEPWIVYLGMFIGGIGGASYLDSFYSQLGDVIPEENRSSFIGNVVSFSELGTIVSPIIAGVLIELFNINAPFYYNMLLVLMAIVIQYFIRLKSKSSRKRPLA
ncbi:MFS transporter [Paenibacillus sp. 28ISP30-2]|nr:MFS transporter [Paenibacillus sp. 28ISP30-2]